MQSPGTIFQIAHTTDNAERTALEWTRTLGLGPWLVRGPFRAPQARFRGESNQAELTVARTFSGGVMVELIQQHNEAPSIFQEHQRAHGFGPHHIAVTTDNFERDAARNTKLFGEAVFEDVLPTRARVSFFETPGGIANYLELVELTPAQLDAYANLKALATNWDGTAPWRHQ